MKAAKTMQDEQQAIRRTIHPEVRVVSEEEGLVDYVASDETIDFYHELILAAGWRFTHFRKNAPLLDSHNYWSVQSQVGRVLSAEVKGGRLEERAKWAIDVAENDLARLGFAMTVAGYLKAVSVGFVPTRFVREYEREDFAAAAQEAGLSAEETARVRCIFLEHEQVELSACVLGANPNALAKAYEDGAVKEEELARCGFGGDEEFEFLTKAGAAFESRECNEAFRAMIALEMGRIYASRPRAKSFSRKPESQAPGATPPTRDAGEAATRRAAEEREKFLAELGRLTARR